jgi:octaprenyl-diphosphate synthase
MNPEYIQRLEKIETALNSWLPEQPYASWFEKTFKLSIAPDLAESLLRPARDLLGRGGKRWRPLLMLLTAESLGGNPEEVLPLAPLVEFCHNASLIHDDIEDNSEERRGKPSVHLIYGNDTAINSGAFLYFLPLACLSSVHFSPETKNRIMETWGLALRRLHLGQSLDIAWHRDYHSLPSFSEYETMCRLKTGGLARMAAELGVYCVKPYEESLAGTYGEAAESLGLGFQILDDAKNLKSGIPGKKRGDDIAEGKKSLPVLIYLHRYPEKLDFVARCFTAAGSQGVSAPEVEEFISALEKAGVLDEAESKGAALIEKSRNFFEEKGGLLAGFAELIN